MHLQALMCLLDMLSCRRAPAVHVSDHCQQQVVHMHAASTGHSAEAGRCCGAVSAALRSQCMTWVDDWGLIFVVC